MAGEIALLEELAAQEHKSWSGWTSYMLERIEREFMEAAGDDDAELLRAFEALNNLPCVKRWIRQFNTDYADLPEKEKESDRIEARKKHDLYAKSVRS